jgi:hypothetical protein
VSSLEVCDPSGLLPSYDCPTIVNEVFLTGNEPTQPDNLYQRWQVNRETGLLATLFTPPELVEEQVYLMAPPEARDWALAAGLPAPPESYDVIFDALATSSEVQITTPALFTSVSGEVSITGKAAGDEFNFYRLLVGKGLNPREWIQVGEDHSEPVFQGELGIWDTQGLNGLYALQLLVVRQDQRVDTAIIQVTVDNRPPEVEILYPDPGQTFNAEQEKAITLRAWAEDELGLEQVEFILDGRSIAKLPQPPYAFPWRATPGRHELKVTAKDRAGNNEEISVTFFVE